MLRYWILDIRHSDSLLFDSWNDSDSTDTARFIKNFRIDELLFADVSFFDRLNEEV